MTPTLLDITMITGLDITSSANPVSLNTKNKFDFKTKSIGGWSGFVSMNMGDGSVSLRDHTAFLLMWLEKFLFCGARCGPTANWQHLAEKLVEKKQFPLGKYLLGYLYQTLSNASAKIAYGTVIGTCGPWWLLQIWLNLITKEVVDRPSLTEEDFPRFELITDEDGEEVTHRRCMSFGEAASRNTGAKLSAELLKDCFCNFYDGFPKNARVWFAYADSASFQLPSDFRFDEINSEKFEKSRKVFTIAITPCILLVGIHQGKNIQISYEFYHPMSAAKQLGLGQLSIGLYFADRIQSRGEITLALMMDRLLNIEGPSLGSIENIEQALFGSKSFDQWWVEWKKHLFHQTTSMYMTDLFSDLIPQTTETSPPHQSESGREIDYAASLLPNGGRLASPIIGFHAPKTASLLQGQMREPIPADAGKKRKTKASVADPSAAEKEVQEAKDKVSRPDKFIPK
uniref:Aminotransferase-like protein n=1 Tax=Oryza sativa subsp. japonica TaxID=39947 RepID=Q6Z0C5_ORYSJ|nr:aminotransferase-like protein [Oryza sativa Japonica Group]